ncbi:MAG: hypothetical protein ACRDN0_34830 [Trebonia sp.]
MTVKKADLEPLTLIAEGGYGAVFATRSDCRLPGDDNALAYKEFTKDLDAQRRSAQAAVTFREGLDPADRIDLDRFAVWPRDLVTGPGGEVSGLVMPLIPDAFFCHLLNSGTGEKDRKVRDLQWLGATAAQRDAAEIDLEEVGQVERLVLLGMLVYAVGRLHKHGWVFGDLSFKNAAFALNPPRVLLLDCDGAAGLSDTGRRQASTPNWDPPECPIEVPPGERRQQDFQDDVSDVYKLGLMILRCLAPGKGMTSARNPSRLAGRLDDEGDVLVARAVSTDRDDRPTAKELYAYIRKTVSPQVHPPEVRYAKLVTPLRVRGMDARIEWQIGNATEVTVKAGDAAPKTVTLSEHPDWYLIKQPEPGPVSIEVTNKFGTVTLGLGEITLYELPAFTPFEAGALPRPGMPRLDTFTLDHMRPVLAAVPAMAFPSVPAIPPLPTADLVTALSDAFTGGAAMPVPLPRLNDAVAEASRVVMDVVMDEARKYAARRQAYPAGHGGLPEEQENYSKAGETR